MKYKYNIKDFFSYSLKTFEESKGNFFIVKLDNNEKIKFLTDESAYSWINIYKYNIFEKAKKLQDQTNSSLNDKQFRFLYYFYAYLFNDLMQLKTILPKNITNILEIGGGIGLLGIFLEQYFKNAKIDIIELYHLNQIEHHDNKIVPLKKPLEVFNLLKTYIKKNLSNRITPIDANKINNYYKNNYNLVYSFRSWCFLYDFEKYDNFVNHTLVKDGVVLADVLLNNKNNISFRKNFKQIKEIDKHLIHERLLGIKK